LKIIEDLTKEQKDVLIFSLESVSTKTVNTIKDLRMIDKICKILEKPDAIIELEDADYTFLKNRFEHYDQWNPTSEMRKLILETADKLNG
jgi:hypothetical protein